MLFDYFIEISEFKIEEGLLSISLEDSIKYELCKLLQSVHDYLLRYRIEALANFSSDFVSELQKNQKKRYNELKESYTMPPALMAKKFREFRCPARDQMMSLVNLDAVERLQIDLSEEIKNNLTNFYLNVNKFTQIKARKAEEEKKRTLRT